jgi:hypothetical protein
MTNRSLGERDNPSCSHLNQLSHHLRPSPKLGSPWSSRSRVMRVTTLHHTHFGKHFLLKTHTFSQIICNKYVKEYKIDCGKRLGGHNNLSQNHIMHKIRGLGLWLKNIGNLCIKGIHSTCCCLTGEGVRARGIGFWLHGLA